MSLVSEGLLRETTIKLCFEVFLLNHSGFESRKRFSSKYKYNEAF